MTGKEALLEAFDRLFDKAAKKLAVECTDEEKEDAKRSFEERFAKLLEALKELQLDELPEEAVKGMEESIDKLRSPDLVALLASVPLAAQAQQLLRQLAFQAAEQRLLEHYISTAEDKYGGN